MRQSGSRFSLHVVDSIFLRINSKIKIPHSIFQPRSRRLAIAYLRSLRYDIVIAGKRE